MNLPIARSHFPQPFVVVNKPGASGSIGLNNVATAPRSGRSRATWRKIQSSRN